MSGEIPTEPGLYQDHAGTPWISDGANWYAIGVGGVQGGTPAFPVTPLRATPEPGGVLDRNQSRDVLDRFRRGEQGVEVTLDHLAQFVRPAAIDRDALIGVLPHFDWCDRGALRDEAPFGDCYADRAALADRILALVRPVAGVTLTPDECGAAAAAIRIVLRLEHEGWTERRRDVARGLAARLEAAS